MFINKITRHHLLVFLALVFASMVCGAMVVARIIYSDSPHFIFLNWNLFLAWLPFLFAWGAYLTAEPVSNTQYSVPSGQWSVVRGLWQLGLGGLWLLFFPNAPYIVTDFMHLRQLGNVPIWYDAILLFAFAFTALLLGFLSLYFMHALVARRFGWLAGWVFVLAVLGVSGFGVYIGRFLRFNSWDVFTDPALLFNDIAAQFARPYLQLRTFVMSALLSIIMLFGYTILFFLPKLGVMRHEE